MSTFQALKEALSHNQSLRLISLTRTTAKNHFIKKQIVHLRRRVIPDPDPVSSQIWSWIPAFAGMTGDTRCLNGVIYSFIFSQIHYKSVKASARQKIIGS